MSLAETLAERLEFAQTLAVMAPEQRQALFAAVDSHPLPEAGDEDWKHTDPASLYVAAAKRPGFPKDHVGAPHWDGRHELNFINGRYKNLRRYERMGDEGCELELGAWSEHRHQVRYVPQSGLARLNAALATDGLRCHLKAGSRGAIRVVFIATPEAAGSAIHLHHEIVSRGGEIDIVFEHHGPDDCDYEVHHSLVLRIEGADADVSVLRWQQEGNRARSHFMAEIIIAGDEHDDDGENDLAWVDYEVGAQLARKDLDVRLEVGHSGFEAGFATLPSSRCRHDCRLTVTHAVPEAVSVTRFRGLVGDRAVVAFDGLLHILPGASGTRADMRLASLPLSDRAEVYAKPQLRIENDDVKCSHGATYGQLDEAALHYLRSRGLAPAEARNLLLRSFLLEASAPLGSGPLQDHLRKLLDGVLPAGDADAAALHALLDAAA